jgi:hypothetical protein
MAHTATDGIGTLAGNTITLDAAVPALDGRWVHVLIEPVDEDIQLSADEQSAMWQQWVQSGKDGPITDDAASRSVFRRVSRRLATEGRRRGKRRSAAELRTLAGGATPH